VITRLTDTISRLALACVLSASLAIPAASDIYRVSPTGDDANSGASWGEAKRTITGALAASPGPAQIWVQEGVYAESLTIGVGGVELYGGFAGTETSLADRCGGETVVDGGGAARPVRINQADGVVLDGLTFRNGSSFGYGGGLYIYHAENAVVRHCVVQDCHSRTGNDGGGIMVSGGSVSFEDVLVRRCWTGGAGGGVALIGADITATRLHVAACEARAGGGFSMYGGRGSVTESVFERNVATSETFEGGGAVWLRKVQQAPFNRCFFRLNEAAYGAALDASDATTTEITNCIFSGNVAGAATVLVRGSGSWPHFINNTMADNVSSFGTSAVFVADYAHASFRNDVIAYNAGPLAAVGRDATGQYDWAYANFWMNSGGPFVDPSDLLAAGPTTTENDPKFLSRDFAEDPMAYQLAPDSAVLDYGGLWTFTDFAGAERPVNSLGRDEAYPDKGAFEYQAVEQHVTLLGWMGRGGTGDQSSVKLHLRVSDLNGNLLADEWVPQSRTGFYLLRGYDFSPASGPYEILFGAPGYVAHREYISALPAYNSTGVNVELYGGDADGNNRVDAADINLVLLNMGKGGESGADITGDDMVDAFDLNLVLSNFGLVGD
jgi:hypothetical protein